MLFTVLTIFTVFNLINAQSIEWRGNSALACDFPGNDLTSVPNAPHQCERKCGETADCTHWSWSSGTCWLKRGVVSKNDAQFTGQLTDLCGVAVSDVKKRFKNDKGEMCDCDHHSGGCTISIVPPPNTACYCMYLGWWTCGGTVVSCKNPSDALCVKPDKSKAACLIGRGDCGGY